MVERVLVLTYQSEAMPDSPSENDIITRAQRHHYRSLTPEEYEALTRYRAEWAKSAGGVKHRFFVLGSFAEGDADRVDELKSYINEEISENALAYRMDDFLSEEDIVLHPILKFKLIADDSHHLLMVCEHDKGGQLIEQGLLIECRSYIDKAHLLKRSYSIEEEKERYSWMQSFGVFEIFEFYDRIHEWESVSDYQRQIEALVDKLI